MFYSLTAVVHGESGAGKSWLADTAPGPRLILDAEGGSKYTPSQPKIVWDPSREEPPVPGRGRMITEDGITAEPVACNWQSCITIIRDFSTMSKVYQWLNSGQHHFKSVVMDSLTEIQKRCLDAVSGTSSPTQQDWGTLLRNMEALVRDFRDLTFHPTNPVQCVVFICISSERGKQGKVSAHLQGQLGTTLPYFVDLVGYLYVEADREVPGLLHRKLLVQPFDGYQAKDRTDIITQTFGAVIDVNTYGFTQLIQAMARRYAQPPVAAVVPQEGVTNE